MSLEVAMKVFEYPSQFYKELAAYVDQYVMELTM